MEAVDTHFECVKSLFDDASVNAVEMTAQGSNEGSQVSVSINQKLSV